MSARSIGRSAAASQNDRNSASRKKDRSSLCTFTFADGRQCRTPRHSGHPHFCFFHARKEAQACAVDQLGRDLSFYTSRHYLSACNLSSALARVFTAAAQGHIKTKTATALAYTAQVLVQTLQLAQHEYIETLGESGWRQTINSHITSNCDYINAQRPLTPQPSTPSPHPAPPVPDPAAAPPTQPQPSAPAPVADSCNGGFTTPSSPSPSPIPPPAPPHGSVGAGRNSTGPVRQPASSSMPRGHNSTVLPSPSTAPPAAPKTPLSIAPTSPDDPTPPASPSPAPSALQVPPSPVIPPQPAPAAPASQPPLPAGIGTLGNWNPPPHSGPPRRTRRGPGRHINLCPSRLP